MMQTLLPILVLQSALHPLALNKQCISSDTCTCAYQEKKKEITFTCNKFEYCSLQDGKGVCLTEINAYGFCDSKLGCLCHTDKARIPKPLLCPANSMCINNGANACVTTVLSAQEKCTAKTGCACKATNPTFFTGGPAYCSFQDTCHSIDGFAWCYKEVVNEEQKCEGPGYCLCVSKDAGIEDKSASLCMSNSICQKDDKNRMFCRDLPQRESEVKEEPKQNGEQLKTKAKKGKGKRNNIVRI